MSVSEGEVFQQASTNISHLFKPIIYALKKPKPTSTLKRVGGVGGSLLLAQNKPFLSPTIKHFLKRREIHSGSSPGEQAVNGLSDVITLVHYWAFPLSLGSFYTNHTRS